MSSHHSRKSQSKKSLEFNQKPIEDEQLEKEGYKICHERTKFPPVTLDKGAIYDGEWLMGNRDGAGK